MGKRGPKPKGDADKLEVLSTRVTTSVRDALEHSAAENGRTFSSEVELRLRRSFEQERAIVEHLGGPRIYALLRTVAAAMNLAGDTAMMYRLDKKIGGETWFNDAYAYDQAVKAISTVLEAFRPPGDVGAPQPMQTIGKIPDDIAEELSTANLGRNAASAVLHDIADAESTIPLPADKTPKKGEKLARSIASGLGPLHGRLKRGKT